ncbi:YdcH family protein [Halopseudomonas pelagia]|uniref:YdcH family protein n=1 Tax=Halopseudomonas pelagia TaxID=553151 RepID=UPI0003A084D1|nr:YdcH family protein [Halopseudomonas pelagia]|tara:strand:- start:282 stop:545 length:264 start_codon:yes stop_codon:yes gene_type:complete
MTLEKHDLIHEMPESKEAIHHLKTSNNHFAKLFDEYHEVDHAVHRFETGVENASDEHLESLKKQRLSLKDQLAGMIRDYDSSILSGS